MGSRSCGGCTLCCKLVPVEEIGKLANTRCQHQSHKGCKVYQGPKFPISCHLWTCAWLAEGPPELRRPDHCGYVVDVMPDTVKATDQVTGEDLIMRVVQVWGDPARRDEVLNDVNLRRFARRMLIEFDVAMLLRWNSYDSIFLIAPETDDGPWRKAQESNVVSREEASSWVAKS